MEKQINLPKLQRYRGAVLGILSLAGGLACAAGMTVHYALNSPDWAAATSLATLTLSGIAGCSAMKRLYPKIPDFELPEPAASYVPWADPIFDEPLDNLDDLKEELEIYKIPDPQERTYLDTQTFKKPQKSA